MTGNTTLARLPGPGTLRMLLVALFVLTGLALLGLVLTSALRFALPPVVFTEIGLLKDFPPAGEPYEIHMEEGMFYLVNTGEELIASYPSHPHPPYCGIRWFHEEKFFIDPCRGTRFWLNGGYKNGPPATMLRYPLVIEEGVVRVDFSQTLPGPELVLPEE